MPYWRLQYDGDNHYTRKEKRMLLLTQEAIAKLEGLTPWWWAWATFVTEEEYDTLPSSKETDGVEYIIVDTHCDLMTAGELFAIASIVDLLSELNTCSYWYADMFIWNWMADITNIPWLPSWKYLRSIGVGQLVMRDTNATEQELYTLFGNQEDAEFFTEVNWVRLFNGVEPV